MPTGNLTTNPSLETDAAGWGVYQATLARVVQPDAPNGGFVAQVSQAAGTFYTIDDTPDTVASTTAGTSYAGTAYVKAASASAVGKPVRVVVREWTPAGAFVNETSSAPVNLTNAFQPISVTGVAQTTGDRIDLYVQQDNAVAGDAFYTDLLSLVPTAPPAGGGGTGRRRRHRRGADRQPDGQPQLRDQHRRVGHLPGHRARTPPRPMADRPMLEPGRWRLGQRPV